MHIKYGKQKLNQACQEILGQDDKYVPKWQMNLLIVYVNVVYYYFGLHKTYPGLQ